MFKGTEKNPAGQLLADGRDHRRPGERVHHHRLHRLFPAHRARASRRQLMDLRGRPHDRPRARPTPTCCPSATSCWRNTTCASPTARTRGSASRSSAALYLNHPYGRPVIGWRPEIEKLNREDALAFYRRFYTPNNAVVVIAGDVTADEVARARRKDLRQGAARAETRPAAAAAGAAADRGAPGHARRSARRPSRACSAAISCRPMPAAKGGEAEALDVLAHILGNGSTSRLYRALVVDKKTRQQCRRLVPGLGARRDPLRRLRDAAARRRASPISKRRSTA